MKKLFFLLLCCVSSAFAQTPFSMLPDENIVHTTMAIKAGGSVGFSIFDDSKQKQGFFILRKIAKPCQRTTGMKLFFTDGSVLELPDAEVFCEPKGYEMELTGVVPMTDELLLRISKSELKSFSIGTEEVPVLRYVDKFDKSSALAGLYKLEMGN